MENAANDSNLCSVVIPVFNGEKTLRAALDSVFSQTEKRLTCIVIDDGSTDRTAEIVQSYPTPALPGRLILVKQSNAGLAGALNRGIHECTTEFVAFHDADDLWHRQKIERHLRHFRDNPELVASFSWSRFLSPRGQPLRLLQAGKTKNITPRDMLLRLPVGNGSAAVMRRSALEEMAIHRSGTTLFQDPSAGMSQDVEFWFRFSRCFPDRIEGIAEPLTYYRVGEPSLSANIDRKLNSLRAVAHALLDRGEISPDDLRSALAFQMRYLSRRCFISGDARGAVSMIWRALGTDIRILLREPRRTLQTVVAVHVLALWPQPWRPWLTKLLSR